MSTSLTQHGDPLWSPLCCCVSVSPPGSLPASPARMLVQTPRLPSPAPCHTIQFISEQWIDVNECLPVGLLRFRKLHDEFIGVSMNLTLHDLISIDSCAIVAALNHVYQSGGANDLFTRFVASSDYSTVRSIEKHVVQESGLKVEYSAVLNLINGLRPGLLIPAVVNLSFHRDESSQFVKAVVCVSAIPNEKSA